MVCCDQGIVKLDWATTLEGFVCLRTKYPFEFGPYFFVSACLELIEIRLTSNYRDDVFVVHHSAISALVQNCVVFVIGTDNNIILVVFWQGLDCVADPGLADAFTFVERSAVSSLVVNHAGDSFVRLFNLEIIVIVSQTRTSF